MKKVTFLLLLLMNVGYSQVTFFNYLDYTSEWRQYGGGWGGSVYSTYYLDGDQTFGSNTYYKFYRSEHRIDTGMFGGDPIITDELYGPGYLREDSNGKFWFYDTTDGTESIWFDNQPVLDANMGDTYNFSGGNCTIENIVNYTLNGRSLKRICGTDTNWNTGTMEGIGDIGMVCSSGVEYNTYLSCYTKDGNTILFGTSDCSLFPTPNRTSLNTLTHSADTISVFPNPSNGIFTVETNLNNSEKKYTVVNLLGSIIRQGNLNNTTQIDLSDVSNGVYFLNINNNNGITTKKIIKQ